MILLQEEHDTILRNRNDSSSGFTWEEYKSLTFTTMVILILIYASVSSLAGLACLDLLPKLT